MRTHLSLAPTACEMICLTGENLVGVAALPFGVAPYVLAPLAGVHRAREDAAVATGRRSLGLGAGLLVGGIATAAGSAFLYAHPAAARRDGLIWGGASMVAAGVAMTWVGAGMLGYGAALHGRRRRVAPTASATANGFSLGVRGRY